MFVEWSWVVGLLVGAAIGSFLNVVIYRIPRGLSLSNPPKSFCPKCKNSLAPVDLVPLFSWLFLRGKCRQCGAKVSSRYFFVELLNGAIWAAIWWQYLVVGHDAGKAIFFAAAASTLVVIIFVDWELFIIPDQVNAFLLAIGLAYNGWLYYKRLPTATTWGMPSAVAGALVGVALLWGMAFLGLLLFRKDAMGHGDIKMARGIGAVLFPTLAVASFGLAVAFGAVLGIVQILIRSRSQEPIKGGGQRADGNLKEHAEPDEEPYVPESLGSLLKCGLGYLLCIDVIGLAVPKVAIAWFGEDPYAPIEDLEEFEVEKTMIPFGPYLALGAIAAAVFQAQLLDGLNAYWKSMAGSPAVLEQFLEFVGH